YNRHIKYVGRDNMERVRRSVRLPEWVANKLNKIAEYNGSSVNTVVTNACIKYSREFDRKYQKLTAEENKN
ncbi:hypothetical protein, partial [Limosilactobacillus reuteri]|uniref:hypothetical protein n=2 Tax=Lactobacillaceae TaxID=33958 RepID=UPI002B052B29